MEKRKNKVLTPKREITKYREFHGKGPVRIYQRKFNYPEKLIFLGYAHKIEYISNKLNGGGDGKTATYVHKFTRGTKLYMDEKMGKQLYIVGAKLQVTDEGIKN